ncbi:MAG TPA: phosphoribosyl-ATP diphosphatase [Kiloniellales bacterium]|nr:phosphoribosyl-ATP diphosphatase [Kiloniellales bacterium]
MAEHVLDKLFAVINERRGADPSESYTAKLLSKGPPRIAKKLGEEAVEVALAGVVENKEAVVTESADLLYHLLVLWAARKIEPADVWEALTERVDVSGLTEKAGRAKD